MYVPKIDKFFNIAGPAQPDIHYTLDPLRRINYDEISLLMNQRSYFILHAPRQTGKTTSLLAMVNKINEEGVYHCAYVNVETAQTARNDVTTGMKTILSRLESSIKRSLNLSIPDIESIRANAGGNSMLIEALESFCSACGKPLVLFIDEIDALVGDTLVSVLRQLRDAYANRPQFAPISVILCGVRDIRDYRIHRSDGEIITGGSCFNIKAASLRLGDFSQDDIRELYLQHTETTGQVFEENVYPKVWDLTRGQPWLVNALADQATAKIPEGRDRNNPITLDIIDEAAERLIISRATHLDQLADKLREKRVENVLEAFFAGGNWTDKPAPDDVEYLIDLGLLRKESGNYVISNGIYREVLPRELTWVTEINMTSRTTQPWYVAPDGKLDMKKLLREFQQFFRENSESWLERFDYKEAGFQLLLQAFLQRIVNGGGLIEREYALGLGRVDLLVRWRYPQNAARGTQKEQRIVLELKTIRERTPAPARILPEGLEQAARYADRSGAEEVHLIVCEERPGYKWDDKIYERVELTEHTKHTEHGGGREINVWGV
ncbi:MAG: ATP-binding protein [Synergistaceae bacterium]|nr:ATP-binding protein [Synergistaceae bacterium]